MQHFKKKNMKHKKTNTAIKAILSLTMIFAFACTDLELGDTSTATLAEVFPGNTAAESDSALDQMYNEIRGYIERI